MASNFDFLIGGWTIFHEDALQAEQHTYTAPRTCAFYARRALEKAVKWLYAHDGSLRMPYQDNLAALIHEPTFQKLVAPSLFSQIRLIHKIATCTIDLSCFSHFDHPCKRDNAVFYPLPRCIVECDRR